MHCFVSHESALDVSTFTERSREFSLTLLQAAWKLICRNDRHVIHELRVARVVEQIASSIAGDVKNCVGLEKTEA